ncbi:Beta-glucosidase, lactase phlorizinhydrolase [Handroanthus impetiginosus]|uniref:Beta-glucosidase, lactase phlorizinhydrolase n=1 Tax=Handroanthus impetiginosus TaxID=429701 RepID=A0A2G9G609_9LAMI|nr:Beta-glucosidase, lactase phlorizinhydrolase [Handroanthus impetiginosus]
MGDQGGNNLAIVSPREQPAVPIEQDNSNLRRFDFPEGFIFGSGTSAYQVEGAYATDGKGLSIWDDFTMRTPNRITDGSNGVLACDMYNRYKEDIRAMKAMGFDAYRFSISWPRILPGGRTSVGINRKGIEYYNDVIDTVIAHGMMPFVTLFHWDLPDILQKEYHGLLSRKVVDDFKEFVEICFWEFGDRVKFWTTLNEPWTVTTFGYVDGTFPPSKASLPPEAAATKLPAHRTGQSRKSPASIPKTRPYSDVKYDMSHPAKDAYTVARNLLLCHATTVNIYRTKFQGFQKGQIGIVLNSHWAVPLDKDSPDDVAAARRAVDFMLGWFLYPVLYGRYPQNMIDFVPPENLAPFSPGESEMLKGSIDFLGINYYMTYYVTTDTTPDIVGYAGDMRCKVINIDESGLNIAPWGIYQQLAYIKNTYTTIPPIIISENGVADKDDPKKTAKQACVDPTRVKYHQDHLANILKAINEINVDVRGYFVWSWCDNFEWAEGYTLRFGINYVDFMHNQTRYPKDSAKWFAKFLMGEKEKTLGPVSNKRPIEDSGNVPEKRSRTT